jgi:hypothetical protein
MGRIIPGRESMAGQTLQLGKPGFKQDYQEVLSPIQEPTQLTALGLRCHACHLASFDWHPQDRAVCHW